MNADTWKSLNHNSVLNIVENRINKELTNLFLPRNSYINRVFELELEETRERIIVKFYRAHRWTEQMILTEHDFLEKLYYSDILVIPPLKFDDQTLFNFNGINFAVFPKKGGRAIDEMDKEQWQQTGRLTGRIHAHSRNFLDPDRIKWRPLSATVQHIKILRDTQSVYSEYQKKFFETAETFINKFDPLFDEQEFILLHGDIHLGNFIHRPDEGIYIIDFDDMCIGPVIQDMWMLLPDKVEKCENEIRWFIDGYEVFHAFPHKSLELIPALRAMRLIHFASWCALQAKEPGFANHFPEWGSIKYWNETIKMLQELIYP
ncbi:MAG: serine/threonine protein kinase [bacterium]|nr:serine/threonine protein kinase [bacterium]